MVGRRRSAGTKQGSPRSGMHGTRATGALAGARHTGTSSSRRSGRLAGTRRTLIERLARARRRRPKWYSRPGRGGTGHSRTWTYMGLRRTRLMPQACRKIGARRNDGPGSRLTNDLPRDWRAGTGCLDRRLRASWMLSKRLPGCGPRMNGRGGPRLTGTGCRARRRSDRHAWPDALRSRRRGRWRGGPWLRRNRLVRRQGLARTGKNLAWPRRRRWNRFGWRRNGAQRSRWRRQRKARRMRDRRSRARSYRRMDRRAASQHWRTQRNGARLVIVRVSFFFRRFGRGSSGRGRLTFISFSERRG